DAMASLGAAPLDGAGHATLATSALPPGIHAISAHYSGDAAFAPSASDPYQQHVGVPAPAIVSPADGFATADPNVKIVVFGVIGAKLRLTDNGTVLAASTIATSDGSFTKTVTLGSGPHLLSA